MSITHAPAPVRSDSHESVASSTQPGDEVNLYPATRLGALLFARLMVAHGSVRTYGAKDDTLDAERIVTHVPDADGFTVAFLTVLDGTPEVTDLDFDFGDRAHRHLLHDDGRGLTLCDYRGVPHIHYRLPDTFAAPVTVAVPTPRQAS